MKLKRYEGNPILEPNEKNSWESFAVLNPGAWYEKGTVYLLYRAAGKDKEHVIRLGLATSENGYDFKRTSDKPAFSPSLDGFDAGCVEDARIVKLNGYYYITYATRPFPPGQYWLDSSIYRPPDLPEEFPPFLRWNTTTSGLVMTKDFKSFIRAGRITPPDVDDRDAILFPEKINGKFVMLHRPMQWVGNKYGTEKPAMWIAFSDNLIEWKEHSLLAKSEVKWEAQKIGGSTPPIKTEYGWLTLYHGVDDKGTYRIGAMLLDLKDPKKIIKRARDFILEPEEYYETEGFYSNCVFPVGNVVIDKTLFVYYGGADKFCCVATCDLNELLDWLLSTDDPK